MLRHEDSWKGRWDTITDETEKKAETEWEVGQKDR